jgi:hypothetical protein
MEYGNVVSRAWQIAWREKKLWVLGFMTSLGLVAIGASQIRWIGDREELGLEAVLGLVWILILIAMVEVSVVARGGLIAGVLQVEGEGSTGFRQAWRVGRKWFWTLFGIALLAGLPTVVLGLVSGGCRSCCWF